MAAVAGLGGSVSRFSFLGTRYDHGAIDLEAGLTHRHSATSISASCDSMAAAGVSTIRRGDNRTSVVLSPWFKSSERIPTVVLVTMRVHQMTVSAVLSEVNLTAIVRNIHGSFTKTNRVRGHSRFLVCLSYRFFVSAIRELIASSFRPL